jgi:copper chaperone
MKTSVLVQNLRCNGCANTITSKWSEIENITNIKVDLETSEIHFNHSYETGINHVINKLKSLGYPQIYDDNSIASKAKSFVSCATVKFN